MRILTRQLYDAVQDRRTRVAATALRRWKSALRKYRTRLSRVVPLLPPGARAFSELSFHDAIVKSVSQARGAIAMRMDVRQSPHWTWPRALICFQNPLRNNDIHIMKGQMWMFEELSIDPRGHVALDVLTRDQEWSIVATDITVDARVPLSKVEIIEWLTDIVQNDRSLREVADIAEPLAPMRLELLRMLRHNRFSDLERERKVAEDVIRKEGLVGDATPDIIHAIQSWLTRSSSTRSNDPTAQA